MRKNKHLALVVASLFLATLWGCGSNMDSGGDQTSPGSGIADAAKLGSSSCKVCHTTIAVGESFNLSVHDTDAVGCEGCHGGGQFHKGVGEIPYSSPGVAQCTAVCHTLTASTSLVRINNSHNDDPATATTIEGLIVKTADAKGCQACHYSDHDPELIINKEWANSAHGGHLATGPVTSATADAWVHYNWDDTATRGSCQRCHTATGISNFLNNPAGYAANGSGNSFSHLSNWSATGGSGQQEVLYCSGCHSDVSEATMADPKLRNPGAITETYTAATAGAPATTVTYPNIGPSNVCIGCHLGREIGKNIANDTDADGVRSFVNSHYLTAGGTVFNTSGYEYAGQTYANFGFHKQIGVGNPASNFNTGSSGPCVACHMSVASGHTFSFVTKDQDGTVIEENNSTLCTNCHAAMDAATLELSKERFEAALQELKLALDAKGIFFFNAHPYFYKGANGTGGAFTDWNSVATTLGVGLATDTTGTGWKNVMGAAFNYNLFEHDPGAYAHNSDYALKLVADSIDFLADGIIDGDASLASTLIGQGMNIASGAGYSPIHDLPVATVVPVPTAAESQLTCSKCHPAAPHYGGGVDIPQWVNAQAVCSDCHASADPRFNQPILSQYAQSGHGNVAGIWTHDEAGSSCQRCHTTSGYIANLAGTTFTFPAAPSAARVQVLNCNACHPTIANGTATFPDASLVTNYTATWSSNSVTTTFSFPDASRSDLCIRCHSGRRGGPQITNNYTYAHYLPGAAGLFGHYDDPAALPVIDNASGIGFEFIGVTGAGVYSDINPHTRAGLGALTGLNGTGTNGPCVACHMSGTAGHTWGPLAKNEATGAILGINSGACVLCHDGTVGDAKAFVIDVAVLQGKKDGFDAALNVLKANLATLGLHYNPTDHSYYRDAALTTYVMGSQTPADYVYVDGIITANPTLDDLAPLTTPRKLLLGAAYNYGYLATHAFGTGTYVMNPKYGKRLIFDSLDFLDNGVLNGTINLVASPAAAAYLQGDANTGNDNAVTRP